MSDSSKNPLICSNCGEYRYLIIKKAIIRDSNKSVEVNVPFFECKHCNQTICAEPEEKIKAFLENELKKTKDGEFYTVESNFENKQFSPYGDLKFKFDSIDYYFIPGLSRPWNKGYLTPVYFNTDLLLYYNNHPDYRVSLATFSSAVIYYKNEPLIPHGFGINRNGKLICWLGDLYTVLSEKENQEHLHRFLASNVESDHDIVSDYYFQQIEAKFTDTDNENKILHQKATFENNIFDKYKLSISKLNIDRLTIDYKHPIVSERQQVFNAYIQLNNLLIETICSSEFKIFLQNNGIPKTDLHNKKGLKLLEIFFTIILRFKDGSSLISPLFVLYDLRVISSHKENSEFEQLYVSCNTRLGLPGDNIDYIIQYRCLIEKIRDMYTEINKRLQIKDE